MQEHGFLPEYLTSEEIEEQSALISSRQLNSSRTIPEEPIDKNSAIGSLPSSVRMRRTRSLGQQRPQFSEDAATRIESLRRVEESELSQVTQPFLVPSNGCFYQVRRCKSGTPADILVKDDEQSSWRDASVNECALCIEYLQSLIAKVAFGESSGRFLSDIKESDGGVSDRSRVRFFTVGGRGVSLAEWAAARRKEDEARPPTVPLRVGNNSPLPPLLHKDPVHSAPAKSHGKSKHLRHPMKLHVQNLD